MHKLKKDKRNDKFATRKNNMETQHTNSTFGFLPTHKSQPQKPKELFFANTRIKTTFTLL